MRDEYALLYLSYRVLSSKIKITPVPTSTTDVLPSLYGVYRDENTVLGYSLGTSIVEDQRNKGTWGLTGNMFSLKQLRAKSASFNAKRDLGPDGADSSHDQGVNPTVASDSTFFQIWSASIAGTNPGAVSFLVQIDYIVEYTDPAVVTPS